MKAHSLKTLLARLVAGRRLDESWEDAGYSSRAEAIAAIEALSKSIEEPPASGARRTAAAHPAKGRAILHADGASRGNPGPSSIAAIVYLPNGEELVSVAKRIGKATNNVAEYRAVIEGMKLAREVGVRELTVRVDSELVMKQLTGAYRIKSADLAPLAREVAAEARHFASCTFEHVRREENREADRLANAALDGRDDA